MYSAESWKAGFKNFVKLQQHSVNIFQFIMLHFHKFRKFVKLQVTKVEVLPIIEESSGCEDGGGFSGSTIIKLVPTYG